MTYFLYYWLATYIFTLVLMLFHTGSINVRGLILTVIGGPMIPFIAIFSAIHWAMEKTNEVCNNFVDWLNEHTPNLWYETHVIKLSWFRRRK